MQGPLPQPSPRRLGRRGNRLRLAWQTPATLVVGSNGGEVVRPVVVHPEHLDDSVAVQLRRLWESQQNHAFGGGVLATEDELSEVGVVGQQNPLLFIGQGQHIWV